MADRYIWRLEGPAICRYRIFRTEFDGTRWWFADPEGYALFSAGIDCIGPSSGMWIAGMEHLLPELPDREGLFRDAWREDGYDPFIANMIQAFGEQWRECWRELTEWRLKDWGINTIGNWSAPDFIGSSKLPYVYPMHSFPSTGMSIYRDFPMYSAPNMRRRRQRSPGSWLCLRKTREW